MTFFKTTLAMAAAAFALSAHADIKTRIVGGSEAAVGEFPFIVSLHERSGHVCGGSLIKKNWVLTAGHCVTGTRLSKVYIGLHDQSSKGSAELHSVSRIIRHPQYNDSTVDFDFALIQLASESSFPPVELNRSEIPISDEPSRQTVATTAGWGETSQTSVMSGDSRQSANRLQKVNVPLASAELCLQGYPDQITERMICAGYPEGQKDACFGDSGGPLVGMDGTSGRQVLIGVVSWGEGCARPGKLGVYSKVNSVIEWIEQTAQ